MIEMTRKEANSVLALAVYGIVEGENHQADWATHINDSYDVPCARNCFEDFLNAIKIMSDAQVERLVEDVREYEKETNEGEGS